MQKVCIDLGYGYTKGLADNGRSVLIPSIVGAGYSRSLAHLLDERTEMTAENLHVKIRDEQGENEYFVGELARKESRTASYAFDDNKINHPNTRALLAATAAMLTEGNKETLLVTGLPLEYFYAQKDEFKRFLESYRAEVTLVGKGHETKRQVRFDEVVLCPQAAGATYDAVKRNKGIFNLKGTLIGIIDIGHKTTDYIVFEVDNGLSLLQSLSGTIKAGISVLHTHLEQEYYRRTNVHLKPIDAERLLRNGGQKMIYGELQDFGQAIVNGSEELANLIKNTIQTRWDHRLEDFPQIFLAGGGAYHLQQQLKGMHRNVTVLDNAQMANVNGFMLVAEIAEKKRRLKAV